MVVKQCVYRCSTNSNCTEFPECSSYYWIYLYTPLTHHVCIYTHAPPQCHKAVAQQKEKRQRIASRVGTRSPGWSYWLHQTQCSAQLGQRTHMYITHHSQKLCRATRWNFSAVRPEPFTLCAVCGCLSLRILGTAKLAMSPCAHKHTHTRHWHIYHLVS